jgi:NAD(P)-dependent dehydrogenase (short-subunit alcohol dehydrogenase family)
MKISLAGRAAVVTGAARGLGLGIAKRLAHSGAALLLIDMLEAELASASAELRTYGGLVEALSLDITAADAPARIRAAAESTFGAADILVNNAGMAISGTIEEFTDEQWDRTLAVNLTAPFRLVRELVPVMAARGFGRVLNISSWTALAGIRQDACYGATKAGLIALTRSIAVDYGSFGVTANAIAPGTIETPLSADILRNADPDSAFMQIVLYNKPISGPGQIDDIASAAAFLVSDEAKHITGQVIAIDGGLTATRFVPDAEGRIERRYLPKEGNLPNVVSAS